MDKVPMHIPQHAAVETGCAPGMARYFVGASPMARFSESLRQGRGRETGESQFEVFYRHAIEIACRGHSGSTRVKSTLNIFGLFYSLVSRVESDPC